MTDLARRCKQGWALPRRIYRLPPLPPTSLSLRDPRFADWVYRESGANGLSNWSFGCTLDTFGSSLDVFWITLGSSGLTLDTSGCLLEPFGLTLDASGCLLGSFELTLGSFGLDVEALRSTWKSFGLIWSCSGLTLGPLGSVWGSSGSPGAAEMPPGAHLGHIASPSKTIETYYVILLF